MEMLWWMEEFDVELVGGWDILESMKALEIAGICPAIKGSEMGREMTKSGPEMQLLVGWRPVANDRPQVSYNSRT